MPTYTKYVMLSAGPGQGPSACTTEAGFRNSLDSGSKIFADTPHVYKRFKALCWCHAMKLYNAECDYGEYDMWDCKTQKKSGNDICKHFGHIRKLKVK